MAYEINGIRGGGELPRIAGSQSGLCLVIGGGYSVWFEIQEFYGLIGRGFENSADFDDNTPVLAVNDIGSFFKPRLGHLVSWHEEILAPTVALRKAHSCNITQTYTHTQEHIHDTGRDIEDFEVPSGSLFKKADWAWHFEQGIGGTSGLMAVMVALALGFNRVVIAGTPLDDKPHFWAPAWETVPQFKSQTQITTWCEARDIWLKDRVKSMGGRTRQWLGYPSKEWLNGS
jgi:hypothetical protein